MLIICARMRTVRDDVGDSDVVIRVYTIMLKMSVFVCVFFKLLSKHSLVATRSLELRVSCDNYVI